MKMDIKEFLRNSIDKNEIEAREYLQKERFNKINQLSKSNGLPLLFKSKTLDNYDESRNTPAYNAAKDFVDKFPNTNGLLLSGNVGVGKTHLAAAIVNELNNKLYSTYFGNIVDIISTLKSTYSRNSSLTEIEAIDIMTSKVDLLIIDDLGKENTTEHNLSLLYRIINRLYENEKPIIITTNCNSKDLIYRLDEWGPAILSRITSMCTPIILSGEDWRIKYGR
ncbi:MAG: ATP-binding protein [Tissierella sp.]|nr:ATP-binding protein [Tissierella sp.]